MHHFPVRAPAFPRSRTGASFRCGAATAPTGLCARILNPSSWRAFLAAASLALCGSTISAAVTDLTPLHDASRLLINPHKGWYHHFPDNHPDKYKVERDSDLLAFPGMDHVYIRLAWSYLEPRENRFDWTPIDPIIDKWTKHGLGIAFRISCKETSTDRREQQFATPHWVLDAGAKGGFFRLGKPEGPDAPWEPVWDDPIFLAKLDHFLAAFAARYDGAPWLRYVDIGSIGDWGEGHTWAGSRIVCSLATRRAHVDLYLKHFKKSQLVISDDYVFALSDLTERRTLHDYIIAKGISYRDDSILVNYYLKTTSDRFTVRSPEFFADAFPRTPTVFELEHYRLVKEAGNWIARPGSSLEKYGAGKTGADYFRGALRLLHASYIGYHGDARNWLEENPELTKELLNLCGYWLFPSSIDLPDKLSLGRSSALTLVMENRGVAPPYAPYELRLKFSGPNLERVITLAKGCRAWLPGAPTSARYEFTVPADLPPGSYAVSLGLFAVEHGRERPVDFALSQKTRDASGYYRMTECRIEKP